VRNLARLARLMLPQWRWALLGVLLSLLTLLANVGLLALSSWFITSMAIAGVAGLFMDTTLAAAGVRALALARCGGRYAERLVNHGTTFRILADLRIWFFERLEPLAPARLARYRGGDLLSRVRADIDTLDDFFLRGAVPFFVALLGAPCIAAFLARYDARLAWVECAVLTVAGALLPAGLKRLAAGPGKERVERAAELRSLIVEEAQGMAELLALGAVDAHAGKIEQASLALDRSQRRLSSLQGVGEAALLAAGPLAAWAAALFLVPAVSAGGVAPADMAMLLVVMLACVETVMPLPAVIQRGGEMAEAARRLFELADMRPAVVEAAAVDGRREPVVAQSVALSIRDLRFRYSPDDPWILDGLSLDLPAGACIAIAGPTGAGKSTIVNVLLRFWDYEGGSITATPTSSVGYELRGRPSEETRRLFSVVSQPPFVFHASIRENLLLGVADAVSDDELLAAMETAQLADLVREIPGGLDAVVGESGRKLSVGEAQRLAMARALLKEAPVLLLDEPTEGLDDTTAAAFLSAVARRLHGRSVLIISHRERDLAIADCVYDLATGSPFHARSAPRPAGVAPRRSGLRQADPTSA
jgi:ATP-binding cassette, subfamily C, bacterial CydC